MLRSKTLRSVMYVHHPRPPKDRNAVIRSKSFRRRMIKLDLATLHRDASPHMHAPLVTTSGADAVLFPMELSNPPRDLDHTD